MTATQRLFFAVWPPPPVLEALEVALGPARRESPTTVRWQPDHRLHITLLFMGSDRTPEAAIIAGDRVAKSFSAEGVHIRSGGRYGAVLWLGVTGDWLTTLHRGLRRQLRTPRDSRPFRPHMTVARVRAGRAPASVLATLRSIDSPAWIPTEFTLVSSRIGPDPQYHVIRRFPFSPETTR